MDRQTDTGRLPSWHLDNTLFATCQNATQIVASTSLEFTWNDPVIVTISDAGFCQETLHHGGITQHFKSQQTYITAPASDDALNFDQMIIHPLC